jgi:hypothetical protein
MSRLLGIEGSAGAVLAAILASMESPHGPGASWLVRAVLPVVIATRVPAKITSNMDQSAIAARRQGAPPVLDQVARGGEIK